MKDLKDQCALLSDNPGLYEAVVVLEEEIMSSPAFGVSDHQTGIRPVLFMGDLETAERIVSCWNIQLGRPTKDIRRGS